MQIDLVLTPEELNHCDLTGKISVVIDVLRFTTTALTALENGAVSVTVTDSPKRARQLKLSSNKQVLLGGERGAVKLPGFDFGNSPFEYTRQAVEGKAIVATTTNGTKAVMACTKATQVLLACIRNSQAVVRYLQAQQKDVVIVPAGLEGRYALEDVWCGGQIIRELTAYELTDGAQLALLLHQQVDVAQLYSAKHGQNLEKLGFRADLDYCFTPGVSESLIQVDMERFSAHLMHSIGGNG